MHNVGPGIVKCETQSGPRYQARIRVSRQVYYGPRRTTREEAEDDLTALRIRHGRPVRHRRAVEHNPRQRCEEVQRVVDMLGWTAEERRGYWDAPVDECPILAIGTELAAVLGRHLTLAEVGLLYGVTRERVRQIEDRALDKIACDFAGWEGHSQSAINRGVTEPEPYG